MSPKLVARMVTHPLRVLENISVSFLDANASLYWDNTFPVKPFAQSSEIARFEWGQTYYIKIEIT